MKYKGIIILSLVLFIAVLAVAFFFDTSDNTVLFSFELDSKEGKERISYWKDDEDEDLYVFLPAYADLSELTFVLHTDNEIKLEDKTVSDGMSCDSFELNKPYRLTYDSWGVGNNTEVTFCRSSNIPAMYIDTSSGNMDYIHQKKGNEEKGTMRLYYADGELGFSGEIESLNGRGNSTWDYFDKKPYSIALKSEADLLSMGTASKWILIANADDFSNIRNKTVYDFSQNIGLEYTPSVQWVDLYLNGEYAGLYLLCERNEIHQNRVDISQTDGFLVSLELEDRLTAQNIPYVKTDSGLALRVHNPLNPTAEDLQKIKEAVQTFENALLSDDGIDSVSGKHWTELIDLDSFVRKYLIEEIFGNIDAGALSHYYYFDTSEENYRIFAGPVWDYDHTMGIDSIWQLRSPQMMIANRPSITSTHETPWFYTLYQQDDFYSCMVRIYTSEFKPLLSELFDSGISEYVSFISDSSYMNKLRWNNVTVTSEEETAYISEYMRERMDFLDSVWIDNTEYVTLRADSSFGAHYTYYSVVPGETFSELPKFDDTDNLAFRGWYYADTNEPFDSSEPIYEYTEVYAKWENTESKLSKVKELIPLGIFAIVFISIFVADIKKNRKGERND